MKEAIGATVLGTLATWLVVYLLQQRCESKPCATPGTCSAKPRDLICPAGYSTEYTSSGHKFCLRIMQDCSKGARE